MGRRKDKVTEIVIKKESGKEIVLSSDHVLEMVSKLVNSMEEVTTWRDDFKMNFIFIQTLLNVKRTFFPATQKKFNVNSKLDFGEQLKVWMKAQEFINIQKYNLENGIVEEPEKKEVIVNIDL